MVTQLHGTSAIAEAMFGEATTSTIWRVERLLQFAHQIGMLQLQGPTNEDLAMKLALSFGAHFRFHVANNSQGIVGDTPVLEEAYRGDAVCRQAAFLVASRIEDLLSKNRDQSRPIVVANAGGVAVSRVVHFLRTYKRVPEESDPLKLLFLSLNSASIPTNYGYSANTLAVRMADIYGGRHIALCPIWPDAIARQYEAAVQNIDLLICGAGTKDGLLYDWLQTQLDLKLPLQAVGDLCLIPIDAQGRELSLTNHGPQLVKQHLNPSPSYADLQAAGSADKVILVLRGYQDDDHSSAQRPRSKTHSKLAVTRAILARNLARTCVLGATLARDLLESQPQR